MENRTQEPMPTLELAAKLLNCFFLLLGPRLLLPQLLILPLQLLILLLQLMIFLLQLPIPAFQLVVLLLQLPVLPLQLPIPAFQLVVLLLQLPVLPLQLPIPAFQLVVLLLQLPVLPLQLPIPAFQLVVLLLQLPVLPLQLLTLRNGSRAQPGGVSRQLGAGYREPDKMMRQLPRHGLVGNMMSGPHPAAPCETHDLHRLINQDIEAAGLEKAQAPRDVRRCQVVENKGRIGRGVQETFLDVALRTWRLVIAVDEEQIPLRSLPAGQIAQAPGTGRRMETYRVTYSAAGEGLLDALAVHRIRERRIDHIEVDAAEGEVAGRPAEPATDLERAAAAKCSRDIIEKHGLIAVDEAHQRLSRIGVPIVRHLAPQIAPGMAELVASSEVRKATIGADDLEPGRDIISFGQGVCGREKLRVRARHYLSLIAEKSGT